MNLGVIILAAGQGSRMKSKLPKVLHELAGKPLLGHVIDAARSLKSQRIVVVYGHGGEQVQAAFPDTDLQWAEQAEQLGTGHAVQQAIPHLEGMDRILILYGDVPLTASETLKLLVDQAGTDFGLLTVNLPNPTGYGRIERDSEGNVKSIVEQKDANVEQLEINEVNTGIMCMSATRLREWLEGLSNNNAQGEYYLTDVLAMAVAESIPIQVVQPDNIDEAEGVNNKIQLAALERAYQQTQAERLMTDGLTIRDPLRFDLRGTLSHGQDCNIDINVIIEGDVVLGDNVSVGANTVLRNIQIADNVRILENCVLEDSKVGAESTIGPFSRLRPGAELLGGAHIGNFVEIKKSVVGQGSKVNHFTYLGDSEVGTGVNIGAGTITCNYDGVNKHKTIIGDNAFIGSNSSLVAPVKIGEGATIGAGSVIGKDAPSDQLTLTRAKQTSLPNWVKPTKAK